MYLGVNRTLNYIGSIVLQALDTFDNAADIKYLLPTRYRNSSLQMDLNLLTLFDFKSSKILYNPVSFEKF